MFVLTMTHLLSSDLGPCAGHTFVDNYCIGCCQMQPMLELPFESSTAGREDALTLRRSPLDRLN